MSNEGAEAAQLIVFARVPQLGQVKSRLAADLGPTRALAVYRRLLNATLATVAQFAQQAPPASLNSHSHSHSHLNLHLNLQLHLCFAGDDSQRELADLAQQHRMTLSQQAGGNLGDRMASALNAALTRGTPAVLIGTDLPTLQPYHLRWAFDALTVADAAFVPVEDGGYGLVGLTRPADSIFADIAWSTDQVMRQTRERMVQMGLSWREGEILWDVDTRADLARWQLIEGTGEGLRNGLSDRLIDDLSDGLSDSERHHS